jgi:carboxymethylenebutenolidase
MEVFQAGDGTARGYMAIPSQVSEPAPGVLVLHAWWGLTGPFMHLCDRLAGEGFVAFAPDLYDGPTATIIEDAERLMESSDGARTRVIAGAAVTHLRGHPGVEAGPIGVVGFSMGAAWALALSALWPHDIAAVVAFYGTVDAVDFSAAHAAYLGHFAEQDDFEAPTAVQGLEEQIRAAGRDVTFHHYPGTHHWFFEEDRPDAYNPEAASLAWERTVSFLRQTLAGS